MLRINQVPYHRGVDELLDTIDMTLLENTRLIEGLGALSTAGLPDITGEDAAIWSGRLTQSEL